MSKNITTINSSNKTPYDKAFYSKVGQTGQSLHLNFIQEKYFEIIGMLKHYQNMGEYGKSKEYIESLVQENMTDEFKKGLLRGLIMGGITDAKLWKDIFNLDSSFLLLEDFIEGLDNMEDKIFKGLKNFVDVYQNPQELIKELMKLGYLEFAYNFILEYEGISELTEEEQDIALSNFEKRYHDNSLFYKMIIFGGADWYVISYYLGGEEKGDVFFKKLKDIFLLSNDEKKQLKELKKKHFSHMYQANIESVEEYYAQIDFSEIFKFTFEKNTNQDQLTQLKSVIKGVLIRLNPFSQFVFHLVDISGQTKALSISNGDMEIMGYDYNLMGKGMFQEELNHFITEFMENLENNDMEWTMMIFEKNKSKDDLPDEEELRIAA